MSEHREGRRPNRLIHETSPYLLQHAYNPVDWYSWGEEALGRAREERKPILLSIGYSACHWCHVMERESFEDERTAALMNEHFVCVKVDREERPDLDEIYMAATQALNSGQGGWPMTVFLTPEQEPFFAGTYYPPRDAYGRPGFPTLLTRLAEIWRERPDQVHEEARAITEHLRHQVAVAQAMPVGPAEIEKAVAQLAEAFDPEFGGFGGAPKFPPATALSLLLRHHCRTGDAHALLMVTRTLTCMARGGIYDQIGGGFARYATDERWLVPHFEKMLYDNALLAPVYLEAFQVTRDPLFGRVGREVLDYVLREMTSKEGAFFSATDADSEGEEGKFFVWTKEEIEQILGPEAARRTCAYFDVRPEGNWEGKSILHAPRPIEEVAATLGVSAEELQATIQEARCKLYAARARRVPPGLDDKILTGWNGLMIRAMAAGAGVLGDARYLDAARRAVDFLLATLRRENGRLLRTYRDGKAHLDAVLEDYAFLAEGLIDLYEAGGEARYLDEAGKLADRIALDFADPETGAFFTTARDHERLILRRREGMDGATPSPNATAAMVLARLSYHFDREDWRQAATRAVMAHGALIRRWPRGFAKSLEAVDFLLDGPVELAVIGAQGDPGREALLREAGRPYLPNRILGHHDPASGESPRPLLRGKGLVEGRAALYVCRNFACEAPITDPARAAEALGAAAKAPEDREGRELGEVLRGHASATGTEGYADRHRAQLPYGFAALGSTELTVSRVGFGGYRVDDETPAHRQALDRALSSGCNLIDTSTNYTDGGSERLVGTTLADLASRGALRREELVVVSKIGYVQGTNLEAAREREAAGRPYPDMVKYGDGVWHCIHPEFLKDQLARSLARLRLQTLDVCLLHNPEYFLSDAVKHRRESAERAREEFYERLRKAFAYLEGEVAADRIRWYGVSSNTAAAPAGDPEATSLTRMLEAAREAGGPYHHFRVLQLPMNLLESAPAFERKEECLTVLDAAQAAGIGVLVNRPLNAMAGEGMLRLAEPPEGRRSHRAGAKRPSSWEGEAPAEPPAINEPAPLESAFDRLLRGAATRAAGRNRGAAAAVSAAIDPALPAERRAEPLSRKAIWTLASTPGVSCVLTGIRSTSYVDDALAVLAWPPMPDPLRVLQSAAGVLAPGPR